MIKEVVGEATNLNVDSFDYKKLKKDQYFWINKNGNAVVFKFESIIGNKIIGINLINNSKVKIDKGFQNWNIIK